MVSDTPALVLATQAPLLRPRTGELDSVIETNPILDLSLNNRTYVSLPSVARPCPHTARGARHSSAPKVAGQPAVRPLQQFKVQSRVIKAEYGPVIAHIYVAARTPGNSIWRAVFDFDPESESETRNHFGRAHPPFPPFERNQFGPAASGNRADFVPLNASNEPESFDISKRLHAQLRQLMRSKPDLCHSNMSKTGKILDDFFPCRTAESAHRTNAVLVSAPQAVQYPWYRAHVRPGNAQQ